MAILMGLDQHRAQITAEWIDTETGEVSRSRVAPADRASVRRFLGRFSGRELEVAPGGRGSASGGAGGDERAAGAEEAREDGLG
jgi:hypothetical protein